MFDGERQGESQRYEIEGKREFVQGIVRIGGARETTETGSGWKGWKVVEDLSTPV